MNATDQTLKPAHLALLMLYATAIFLLGLGGSRVFTHHELYVVEGAREMLRLGDWLVPRILGEPWLEKPPLAHWAVALSFKAGGLSEAVARFPSAVCAMIGVVLIARLAARWYGSASGLVAGLIQATTVYTLTYARLAESDIYLWAIVIGALCLFAVENVGPSPSPPRAWRRFLFWVLVGLTQYAKGPLFGAVMVLVPCLLFTALVREPQRWRWFLHWPGWIACVALALAWPAAILVRYPGTANLWFQHTFARVGGGEVINPEPWWLYVQTAPWQILPWTLLVWAALAPSMRVAWREPTSIDRFLWGWFAGLFVVLSIPSAKHHHYLIYALPPFSFWTLRAMRPAGEFLGRLFAAPARFAGAAVVGAVLLLVAFLLSRSYALKIAGDLAWLLPLLWLMMTLVIAFCARGFWPLAAGALFAGLAVIIVLVHYTVMPARDHRAADVAMLHRLKARLAPDDKVVSAGGDARAQWFYLDREVRPVTKLAPFAPAQLTPGTYVVGGMAGPGLPPNVRTERVDQGTTIVLDRVVP